MRCAVSFFAAELRSNRAHHRQRKEDFRERELYRADSHRERSQRYGRDNRDKQPGVECESHWTKQGASVAGRACNSTKRPIWSECCPFRMLKCRSSDETQLPCDDRAVRRAAQIWIVY